MLQNNRIMSLLPANIQTDFYKLTKITVGIGEPQTFIIEKGALELLKLLFPDLSIQLDLRPNFLPVFGRVFGLFWTHAALFCKC